MGFEFSLGRQHESALPNAGARHLLRVEVIGTGQQDAEHLIAEAHIALDCHPRRRGGSQQHWPGLAMRLSKLVES